VTDARLPRIQRALSTTAGGYLRNPGGPGTCSRCFTAVDSTSLCSACQAVAGRADMPDLIGMLTYGGYLDPITQAGRLMRLYKSPAFPQGGSYRQTVTLLAALGLIGHVTCPGRLTGAPITAWATVPSLPPRPEQASHPFNDIVRSLARPGAIEVPLTAAAVVSNPRAINVSHYTAGRAAAGQHVLLVDDTWTSGGHATSAALALRAAGASHVSVLVLARWLKIGWEATTTTWAKQRLTSPDFDPDQCPWTQSTCPP
jgi:hypothetical protein